MSRHPFRKRYLFVATLAILGISYVAVGKPRQRSAEVAPPDHPAPEVVVAAAPAEAKAEPAEDAVVAPPPAAAKASASACPADMVLVDGLFCTNPKQECIDWMEDPEKTPYARCARYKENPTCSGERVHMRFCMDKEEYSNAGEDLPRGDTSWTQAKGICESQGKRLCAEKEWTFACEGEEMRPYPYGYTRDPSLCNFEQDNLVLKGELRDGRVAKTANQQCLSPFGVHNMVGNIDEWVVLDRPHYSARNNYRKMNSGLKGGWWGPLRNRCRPTTVDHDEAFHELQTGVRCCAEAEDTSQKRAANDLASVELQAHRKGGPTTGSALSSLRDLRSPRRGGPGSGIPVRAWTRAPSSTCSAGGSVVRSPSW